MHRFAQLLFVVSLVLLSWCLMMAVHELGHVLGAILTGGTVERVVLGPLTISRTDVAPNRHPAVVVWLGPVVGCLFPLAVLAILPRRLVVLRNMAQFFAAFCLVANGAYISLGSFHRAGDCGEMLPTGTPLVVMLAFGVATIPLGLYLWHGLGSPAQFIRHPSTVTPRLAFGTAGALILLVAIELVLFSQ